MPSEHLHGESFCSVWNFTVAIRRSLIIFALCWHSLSMHGLSLIFIIQGVFLLLSWLYYFSLNMNHGNQQLNDSIGNVMAANHRHCHLVFEHLLCARYSANDLYTLARRTWPFLLLLYFSGWIKICCISICLLHILCPRQSPVHRTCVIHVPAPALNECPFYKQEQLEVT